MNFQKLLFNFVALLIIPVTSSSEVIVSHWASKAPIKDKETLDQIAKAFNGYDHTGNALAHDKIKTYHDLQTSWISWAKSSYVDVKIHSEAIFNFLPRIITEKNPSMRFGFEGIIVRHEGIHFKYNFTPKSGGLTEKRTSYLKATESTYSGKNIIDPFRIIQNRANYYDERFLAEWDAFWKSMEKRASDGGYKSLDGYCLDTYSAWCQKKYKKPFYFFLNPQDVDHHARLFKRTTYREFTRTPGDKLILGSPPWTGRWDQKWEYLNFCIRWILVFEVWKNEEFTYEIRTGWVKELQLAMDKGYPYRVSFNYKGSVWGLINESAKKYNGDNVKCYLNGGTDGSISLFF